MPCQLTKLGYVASCPYIGKYASKGTIITRLENSCTYKVFATVLVIGANLNRIKDPKDTQDQDSMAIYILTKDCVDLPGS